MKSKRLVPMEPKMHPYPFLDPDYTFQVKWDGVRMLAYIENRQVQLFNRKLKDKTSQYPELQELHQLIDAKQAILDGELVVLNQGKPSFSRIIQRDFAANPLSIRHLAQKLPVLYAVFDLLFINGTDWRDYPLEERYHKLLTVTPEADFLHITQNFADGNALYDATEKQGLEGIVAKLAKSPYVGGKKTAYWLKIKHRRQQLCTIGGYTLKNKRPSALLLGAYNNGQLIYLGRVGSGLTGEHWGYLAPYLQKNLQKTSPFNRLTRFSGLEVKWVEPTLTVLVEFQEWTEELSLRAPVIKGFSKEQPEKAVLE